MQYVMLGSRSPDGRDSNVLRYRDLDRKLRIHLRDAELVTSIHMGSEEVDIVV